MALGERPAELVVRNARLVNVYTGELQPGMGLAAAGGRVAYLGPEVDFAIGPRTEVLEAEDRVLVPGLIDGHTHLAWRFSIERFIPFALRGGTTAAVSEGIELASILGAEGFRITLQSFRDQPFRIFVTLPPLSALQPFLEEVRIPLAEARRFLADPQVVGVGEIYWPNLLRDDPYLDALVELARTMGKTVEGHGAGARGAKLQAYLASGVAADHEPTLAEEGLERVRLGAWLMARHGAVRQDLPELARVWREIPDPRRLIITTDTMDTRELVEEGCLDVLVRRAVELGIPPVAAIQALSLNVAERFGLDGEIGGLAPGRRADFCLAPGFQGFRPDLVVYDGRVAVRDGEVRLRARDPRYPQACYGTVRLPELAEADFRTPPPGRYRAIEQRTHLVTQETTVRIDGRLPPDVLLCAAIERVGGTGERFVGLLKGFGLRGGAAGTSMAWDCQCIVVVGDSPADMLQVARHLAETGGGVAVASGGRISAVYEAPVGGMLTQAPLPEVLRQERGVNRAMQALGCSSPDPFTTLGVLTAAAIPFLRITQRGYVDVRSGRLLGLEPEPGR